MGRVPSSGRYFARRSRELRSRVVLRVAVSVMILSLVSPVQASAATYSLSLSRQSVATNGTQVGAPSYMGSISGNARLVAFRSDSATIAAGAGAHPGVFVRDTVSRETSCASRGYVGQAADGPSGSPVLSADGRYVVFESLATNLVPGDVNGSYDIFRRELASGATELVSVGMGGSAGNADSHTPAVSADGRYVAFVSSASDLVVGDTYGYEDVFVRDMLAHTTVRVSVSSSGGQARGVSSAPAISSDGRFVAFASTAATLVAGDTNAASDVFVRDTGSKVTTRVSVSSAGAQGNLGSYAPAIGGAVPVVAFESLSTNLVAGDGNGVRDVFVRNTATGKTTRVSVSSGGVEGNLESREPAVSSSGALVAFSSIASNLVAGDSNGHSDVFLTDASGAGITRLSVNSAGVQGNAGSTSVAISASGTHAVFDSLASNLVPGDTNLSGDVFVSQFLPVAPTGTRVYRRFAGANRYRVAVSISQHSFPTGAPAVVIATGENWPDALGGSALAGTVGGPLLLTTSASLPSNVQAEIVRLGAKKAYVLGGTGSVGPAVEARLKSLLGSGNVTRLGGSNRYQVATAVGAKVVSLQSGAYDGTALVATGGNYPDALAGSPIAAATGRPIVLANPATGAFTLPPGTKKAVIFGGPGSVSPGVEAALKARLGTANVMRLGGADRYAAAAGIAQWGVDSCGLAWDDLAIATGEKFPDALSGGVMAGRKGSVVMLTRATVLPSATSAKLSANKASIHQVNVCGGTGSVSDSVMTGIKKALGE